MLKELKLKFILHNMLLLSIVITIILASLCIFTLFREEFKLASQLEKNIEFWQENILHPEEAEATEGLGYCVDITVLVNKNGKVVALSTEDVDPSLLEDAVEYAFKTDSARGHIAPLELSYMKAEVTAGTMISFLSREHLDERVGESITQSVLVGLISLLVFLYISKCIADAAIAPVEEAWKQQKQFIADASHDLKTPLTVILANHNIITAHKDSTVESQMKWIESTGAEAAHMSDLINKMLELAKNDAMYENLSVNEHCISDIVENAILQFEVVAFEKNITIESGIQPYIFAKTHPATLSKILEILFDNAIKYSDENGKISIALYQSAKKIFFTINNKGEYISEEDLPHVFERFYRSNKERKVGGHGIGLSLAKRKCDLLSIKISVTSNPEDGTTFTLMFKGNKK